MARPDPRTTAFTLIEVLAAVALSTVLLMVLTTVAMSVKKGERQLAAHAAEGERHDAIFDLFRHDLVHARTIEIEQDLLIIDGYGALDGESLAPLHRPAIVTYALAEVGETVGLLRHQETVGGDVFAELVAVGVTGFVLEPELDKEEEERLALLPPGPEGEMEEAEEMRGPMPPPLAARLTVRWERGEAGLRIELR